MWNTNYNLKNVELKFRLRSSLRGGNSGLCVYHIRPSVLLCVYDISAARHFAVYYANSVFEVF